MRGEFFSDFPDARSRSGDLGGQCFRGFARASGVRMGGAWLVQAWVGMLQATRILRLDRLELTGGGRVSSANSREYLAKTPSAHFQRRRGPSAFPSLRDSTTSRDRRRDNRRWK